MSDPNTPANRPATIPGRFVKGISGNPSGRPKLVGEEREVMELARKYGKRAVRRLAQLMRSKNERVAVAAAQAILDRGFGKPAQAVTGANGSPLFPAVVLSAEPISDAIRAGQIYEQIMREPLMDLASIAFAPAALPASQEAAVDAITVEPSRSIERAVIASHVEARPIGGELLPHGTPDDEVNS
jgi:hypothetical protein